jgi:purine-binding chemotaxis protein CheW
VVAESVRDRQSRDEDDRRIVEPSVRKFLTYTAGIEVATPLSQISEIVPYPTDVIPFVDGGGVRGLFTHRKASVPLVHLPTLLGQGGDLRRIIAAGAG